MLLLHTSIDAFILLMSYFLAGIAFERLSYFCILFLISSTIPFYNPFHTERMTGNQI